MDESKSVRSIDDVLSGKVAVLDSGLKTSPKDAPFAKGDVDSNYSILDWINLEIQTDTLLKAESFRNINSLVLDDCEEDKAEDCIIAPLSSCKIDNDVINNNAEERTTIVLRLRNCDHYEAPPTAIKFTAITSTTHHISSTAQTLVQPILAASNR